MKKTIIGSVLLLSGVISSICIIITAALFIPRITSWRGSKLWWAIFAGSGSSQSLDLGTPFIFGLILLALGLLILFIEYFKKE